MGNLNQNEGDADGRLPLQRDLPDEVVTFFSFLLFVFCFFDFHR